MQWDIYLLVSNKTERISALSVIMKQKYLFYFIIFLKFAISGIEIDVGSVLGWLG